MTEALRKAALELRAVMDEHGAEMPLQLIPYVKALDAALAAPEPTFETDPMRMPFNTPPFAFEEQDAPEPTQEQRPTRQQVTEWVGMAAKEPSRHERRDSQVTDIMDRIAALAYAAGRASKEGS